MSGATTPQDDALAGDALSLLRTLSGPSGIHASATATTNYRAVFARDAVMAGVAGLLAGDAVIVGGLVRTLEQLRALQGPQGQIASNYELRGGGRPPHVSFGTLVPRIDAAAWYVIGVALAARAGALDPAPFRDSVRAVVSLLDALEYNGRHLIYIPPGGDWADEYVHDGYILYDQVLRHWGTRLTGALYDEPAWREKADRIAHAIEAHYWPDDRLERGHPIAAFSPLGVRDAFDLAACGLLALSGAATAARTSTTLAWISARFLARSELPPAFHPVIGPSHPDWSALRRYHLHAFRNQPHEYHNGGIWPIWLGWLALALAHGGRLADLERLREMVRARLATATDFAFQEYLHGVTGAPGGVPAMAYTATGLLFLHLAGSPEQRRLLAP